MFKRSRVSMAVLLGIAMMKTSVRTGVGGGSSDIEGAGGGMTKEDHHLEPATNEKTESAI